MGDYSAATPTPGASWRQDYAIELALRMVAPVEHDGLKRPLSHDARTAARGEHSEVNRRTRKKTHVRYLRRRQCL